jgi:hypothetical protein
MKQLEEKLEIAWGVDALDVKEKRFLKEYGLVGAGLEKARKSAVTLFGLNAARREKTFPANYEWFTTDGGILLDREEYQMLKKISALSHEKFIFILEDLPGNSPGLSFRFPNTASWRNLQSGERVSFEVFERPIRNYFVFGDSLDWGKYVRSDLLEPTDTFGFVPSLRHEFLKLRTLLGLGSA